MSKFKYPMIVCFLVMVVPALTFSTKYIKADVPVVGGCGKPTEGGGTIAVTGSGKYDSRCEGKSSCFNDYTCASIGSIPVADRPVEYPAGFKFVKTVAREDSGECEGGILSATGCSRAGSTCFPWVSA